MSLLVEFVCMQNCQVENKEKLEFLSYFKMVGVLFFFFTFSYDFTVTFFCVHYVNAWAGKYLIIAPVKFNT